MGSEEVGIGTATRVQLEHVGEKIQMGAYLNYLAVGATLKTSSMIRYVTYLRETLMVAEHMASFALELT